MRWGSKAGWLCLSVSTCLICLCLSAANAAEENIMRDPVELFNVLQYHIPGLHNDIEVVCHLFLRCKEQEGFVDVQGFAVIEGVKEVHLQGGPQIAEPWDARLQNLTVSFHNATRFKLATFKVLEADLFPSVRPKVLALTMAKEKFDKIYWLSFNEATRLIAVGDDLRRRCTPYEEKKDMKAAIFLPPPFKMPSGVVAKLIRFHLHYHLSMGFDHEVMYSRSSDAVKITSFIKDSVSRNRFFLVSWTGQETGISLPNADYHNGHPLAYYDQSIISNHALLSYWGRSTYVMFLDLDEYFYSPGDLKVTELYQSQGCLNDIKHQAKIRRFFTICNDCNEKSDWKSWLSVGDLAIFSHYKYLWRSNTSEFADIWDLKTIADPDIIRHYHVHWGSPVSDFIKEGEALEGLSDSTCAIIVHFMNLFVNRLTFMAHEREDVEALQAVVADPNAAGFIKLEFSVSRRVLDGDSIGLITDAGLPDALHDARNYVLKESRNGTILNLVM